MAKMPARVTSAVAPLSAIASGWITWLWFWPLGLWVHLPLLVWSARGGRRSAVVGLLPSPFFLVPLLGVVSASTAYNQGQAVLHTAHMKTIESHNLHPVYRVPIAPVQAEIDGRARFYHLPYDGVVRFLNTVTGPMPQSYTGYYPTRAQAWTALSTAPPAHVAGDEIQVAGLRVVARSLAPTLSEGDRLRGRQVGQTIIVGHPSQLWLLDGRSGVAFATYRRAGAAWLTEWPPAQPAPPPAPTVAQRQPRQQGYASPPAY